MEMLTIGIIIGSTRPGRVGRGVGEWVYKKALDHGGAEFKLVDLEDFALPILDEETVPMMAAGTKPHTVRWAEQIAGFDGFVFVTPEYNRGIPASLKNAVDYLYTEWNNKVAGFVGYGVDGGVRSVEHMRGVLSMVRMATVGPQVALTLADDFQEHTGVAPRAKHQPMLSAMLSDLVAWGEALRDVRAKA
jgi:NAD(P)H-dependent FMN reductase